MNEHYRTTTLDDGRRMITEREQLVASHCICDDTHDRWILSTVEKMEYLAQELGDDFTIDEFKNWMGY